MNQKEKEIQGHKQETYENRDDLAGEHRFSDLGQLILLVCFLVLWIFDSFALYLSTFLVLYVPNYVRAILACIVMIIAGYLAYKAHKGIFGEERETPEVISKGVFAYVRHPMYLGSILFYLGLILISLSLLSLALWIIIIIFYNYIASYEEKLLIKKFGDEYRVYQSRVAKWIPGLKFKKKELDR